MKIIITAPSLDTSQNVSGVSAVTNFIINNNSSHYYEHFLQGRNDSEKEGTMGRLIRVVKNYVQWKNTIKKNKYGIIHYNYPLDTPSILRDYFFMRFAKRRGESILIHIHGGLYLFKKGKPWIIRLILNDVFSWSCPFIVLSEKEKSVIQQEYRTRNVYVLPNCVDLTDASNYNRTNVQDKILHILYLGRVEPNKGVDYLLSASEKLKAEGVKFVLHIAGRDQCKDYYIPLFQESLKESFVYEGIVTGHSKTELLKKCQLFILPSFYEGLPISLLEAMSFGEVPIVTDVGSIGEVVKGRVNGIIVRTKDSDSIVDAIQQLNNDRSLLKNLSERAKSTIMNNYSPDEYISKLNVIYESYKS